MTIKNEERLAGRNRRRFLRGVGATGIAGVLAGCLGGGGDDNGEGNGEDGSGDNGDDGNGDNGDTAPPSFEVNDLVPGDDTVTRGETIEVVATIENAGDEDGSQDVQFQFGGETEATEELEIAGGGNTEVSFEVDTVDLDPDAYDYEVQTDDDAAGGTLTVEGALGDDPAALVSFEGDVSTLTPDDSTVTATLDNPYSVALESGEVELGVPDGWEVVEESGTSFETLEGGASQDVEWDLSVPEDADGEYTLEIDVSYESGPEEADVAVTRSAFVVDPDAFEDGLETYFPMDAEPPIDQLTGREAAVSGEPEFGVEGYVDEAVRVTEQGQTVVAEGVPVNGEEATVTCWFRYTDITDYARVLYLGDVSGVGGRPTNGLEFQFRPEEEGTDPHLVETQVLGAGDAGYTKVGGDDSEIPVYPETWYFAAVVMDGEETRFHLFDEDGELDPSPKTLEGGRGTSEPPETDITMLHGDNNPLFGRIDEVKGYTRALSEAEVAERFEEYVSE